MNTKGFVEKHRIRAASEWADANPHMEDFEGNHFKVLLRRNGRQMQVYFSKGYGLRGEPTAAEVLDCLASDAYGAGQPFEPWASELGYDPDSRKAERIYKSTKQQTARLERFLGTALLDELIYKVDRD